MKCRHCNDELSLELIDLGGAPPSNVFHAARDEPETAFSLRVLVCTNCWLAQTDISRFTLGYDEVFTAAYPYYSSTSASFVEHARRYVGQVTERFKLGPDSLTVEIGSNDGYLLQHVKTPCYGVEPTRTGEAAQAKGIETFAKFFTSNLASELAAARGEADLVIANNVLAHVPDINDFVKGIARLLKPTGVATFEFPSLLNLVRFSQFDTIYHEHYSYLSLTSVIRILVAAGMRVFDLEHLPTHGGSLRVYAAKDGRAHSAAVLSQIGEERYHGMVTPHFYQPDFQAAADRIKDDLLEFLLHAKAMKRTVAAFGAAAKGNTLLNYAGVKRDLLAYVVDETPAKQGKFLPGSRIPVVANFITRPDYVLILPWNFRKEILDKLAFVRNWGAHFVCAVPKLEIL